MNKKIKIVLTLLLCISSFLFIFGCGEQVGEQVSQNETNLGTSFDYKMYESEKSIIDDADVIIIGEVIEVHEPEEIIVGKAIKNPEAKTINNNDEYKEEKDIKFVYTVSDIKIEKVLKGNYKVGDIIKVKQNGDEKKPEFVESIKYYRKNSRQIFFLQTYPETNVPASALNPTQGQIDLTDNKISKSMENKLFENIKSEEEIINKIEKVIMSK